MQRLSLSPDFVYENFGHKEHIVSQRRMINALSRIIMSVWYKARGDRS